MHNILHQFRNVLYSYRCGSWVCGYQHGCVVGINMRLCCGYRCGCVVVHGYWRGSIYLIFLKLCCALIYDLVRLFCFVFCLLVLFCSFFFWSLFLFFCFFGFCVVGGCRLRSGRGRLLGAGFFFSFLLLWFIVVAGGAMVEMVEVGDAIVLVFVMVFY